MPAWRAKIDRARPSEAALLTENQQQAVARGLRRGERTAWTTLYDAYSADVWRYAARLIGSDAAAVADVVQEVFLAAARSASRFDPQRGTLWGWLAGITHHAVAAHWRELGRQRRLQATVTSGQPDIGRLLESEEPAEAWLEQRELTDLVRYVLSELPADYAWLLTAKYLDDFTLEQLATQTGASTEAVKSKLARARCEFRGKFQSCSGAGFQPAGKSINQ